MINCSNIQKEDASIKRDIEDKPRGLQQSLNLIILYYVIESCWIFEIYSKISILFWIFVTLYRKIRKSQEILGNQDSANP